MAILSQFKNLCGVAVVMAMLSPLPITSALADVEIIRDKSGMAHVYGDNNYEVFYGFGYISARDRLFQMEVRKRQTLGRSAEVFGRGQGKWVNKYVEKDTAALVKLDLDSLMAQYEALSTDDKTVINAFTDGINAAIDEMMENPQALLAAPFHHYKFFPEKWRVVDTLAVSADILGSYSAFTTQQENMELYSYLYKNFPNNCEDVFGQFIWLDDPTAPTTKMDHVRDSRTIQHPGPRGCGRGESAINGLNFGSGQLSMNHLAPPQAEPRRTSMSWSVGANRAVGFKSIFLSGPQPGWNSPSVYYPIGLHGGDFDVVGWSPAGSFVVRMGASRYFSWSSTSGLSGQTDTYQETLSADGKSYFYKNAWLPLESRQITIRVRNEPDVSDTLYRTHHGPVVAMPEGGSNLAFSEKTIWIGNEASSVMAWLNSAKARTFQEWMGYMNRIDFNYNLFYTDKEGYVGFAHTGAFPLRQPGHDFRLPASGDGRFEWLGRRPVQDNPHDVNMDAIVNFNNKPQRNWSNTGLYWEPWSAINQATIPLREFAKKQKLDWNDIWAINRIVAHTDVNAPHLIPFITRAGAGLNQSSELGEAVALLSQWSQLRVDDNGDKFVDHAGQTIFDAWLPIMVQNTLGDTLKDYKGAKTWVDAGYAQVRPRLEEHPAVGVMATVYAILNRDGSAGVRHYYDFFGGRDPNDVILGSLSQALAELKKKYKGPMAGWLAPTTTHFFYESSGGRYPISLPSATFELPVYMNRGAVNQMTGYGLDGKSVTMGYVSPPGPVGHIAPGTKPEDNPYVANHLKAYRDYQLFDAYFDKKDVLENMGVGGVLKVTIRRAKL